MLESARINGTKLPLGEEQDAYECLTVFTDSIVEELHLPEDVGPFPVLSLETHTTCPKCQHKGVRTSTLTELSLSIPSVRRNAHTDLVTCFRHFIQPETVVLDCVGSCRNKKAEKKDKFLAFPPTLVLHLKRFHNDNTKITTKVQFPPKLNLSEFCPKTNQFQLFGVLCHRGASAKGGHYISYVLSKGKWWCCDDRTVEEVPEKTVLTSEPYILFYQEM